MPDGVHVLSVRCPHCNNIAIAGSVIVTIDVPMRCKDCGTFLAVNSEGQAYDASEGPADV